ncbi:hypothetical protein [Limnobacter sp.]|uniref:hypothetical protein n=1 Tax=Limnobacter sp. TaxID=2003368 RepID=UPI003BAB1387
MIATPCGEPLASDTQLSVYFAYRGHAITLSAQNISRLTMRCSAFFVFLASLPIISACSAFDQRLSTQLFMNLKSECELIFKSQNVSVVENFCSTEGKPILIRMNDQEIRSDWIDERTSRFLFQEGCASSDECFYELSTNEAGVRGRFSYRINMTEGEYSFEVGASGQPKVLTEKSKDSAS